MIDWPDLTFPPINLWNAPTVTLKEKKCTKCYEIKPVDEFSVTKRNEDGSVRYRSSWCKACKNEHEIAKRGGRVKPIPDIGDGCKQCLKCMEVKPFDMFSPASRGRFGLAAYCKPCMNEKYDRSDESRRKAREATAKYREKHKYRWRAKHRLHQFKRKQLIKATDDGTVTDEYLEFIYNLVKCFWCGKDTQPEERTLEHVQELSDGGKHTKTNVCMACRSCNSARKGRKK